MAGLLDFIGNMGATPPSYMEGLLGADQMDKLKGQATSTGLANMVLGYLAAPKNQNLGLGRILGGAVQAGMQGAQGVYSGALDDYQTKAKIDEMQRQKALAERDLSRQTQIEALTPTLFKTNPAQYQNVQAPDTMVSATPEVGAVTPNFNLQPVAGETTRQLISPETRTVDTAVLQKIASLSKDPMAALTAQADLIPKLRKAGLVQNVNAQDNPFEVWKATATSPAVQKLADQYSKSYTNGLIDEETALKRSAELASAEDKYSGRIDTAEARKQQNDIQNQLNKMVADGRISQQEASAELARQTMALRQQLASQKNDNKVLPPTAQKIIGTHIDDAFNNVTLANNLDRVMNTVVSSKIDFNPANNLRMATKSNLGSTDPDVMVYNTVNEFKKQFVNAKLVLNKGTQTEGDAIRAMDEISKARSTPDLVRSLGNLRSAYARLADQENSMAQSKLKSFGLTEDKGYSPYVPVPVPKYNPVIYDGKSQAYKALPIGSTYVNGLTGATKIKTAD